MYGVKYAPFRYNGAINVENCKTAADVMSAAGLNWKVEKCPLVAKMPILDNNKYGFNYDNNNYVDCNNAYATYRTDYNIPLGIVKGRYTIVQNIDAFNFFDNAIGKDKAIWQTAGFFGNGERIFVSAKLPKNIIVNGTDPVENYLVFTTSHDGSSGVKILFTPIRIICQNTLNAAIKNATNYISFRHTNSVHKNIDIANEILGICNRNIYNLEQQYNRFAKEECGDSFAQTIFANTILSNTELENIKLTGHNIHQIIMRDNIAITDSNISMKKVNVLSEINNYYYDGIGQKEFIGTKWGVLNAISGYYSNVDNSEGLKRMDSLLFGDKANKLELSNKLLLEEV